MKSDDVSSNFSIYTDIATLFDVRLGALRLHDDTLAKQIGKKYWTRKFLNWEKFTSGKVNNDMLEALDNTEVLHHSHVTSVHHYLRHLLKAHRDNLSRDLVDKPMTLIVDTHGYQMSDEEKTLLADSYLDLVGDSLLQIRMVDLGFDIVTPTYVDQHYGALLLYNGMDWLGQHREELMSLSDESRKPDGITTNLTAVELIVPEMHNKEVGALTTKDEKTGFHVFKVAVSAYISLEYLPVMVFCEDRSNVDAA